MNPPTSLELLERYEEIAREKLNYVYLGNVEKEAITHCPRCKSTVLKRRGYLTENQGVDEEGRCSFCHTPLGIVMK
jgi:pyruvate formate lyase activating enzyme